MTKIILKTTPLVVFLVLFASGLTAAVTPNATLTADQLATRFLAEATFGPSPIPALPPPAELLPRLDVGECLGDPLEPLPLGNATCLSLMGTDRSEGVLLTEVNTRPASHGAGRVHTYVFTEEFARKIEAIHHGVGFDDN